MDISAYQHMNIRMSTRGKRPLRNLTPNDKMRAIQRIHNGETKASVSRDIGVPESTLRGWCKNEQKLRFMCRQLDTDPLPAVSAVDNPPEKRHKFDVGHFAAPKFANAHISYEELAFTRLPIIKGLDLAAAGNSKNISNSSSAVLDKISTNEFMLQMQANSCKPFLANGANLQDANAVTVPTIVDYAQQFSIVQNLNFLTLLNPRLVALSENSKNADCFEGSSLNRTKVDSAPAAERDLVNSKINLPLLAVKGWAKDPTENASYSTNKINSNSNSSSSSSSKRNINDTNNNDVKVKQLMTPLAFPDMANFSQLLPTGFPLPPLPTQVSSASSDAEKNNVALLEWCKVFNASLNFLALAATTAALQPPLVPPIVNYAGDENASKAARDLPQENLLYKHLTKVAWRPFNSPVNPMLTHSDISNDSVLDSEPEDLSVRSTTSKISSPANSRSQSPAKSIATSSESAHSDAEH